MIDNKAPAFIRTLNTFGAELVPPKGGSKDWQGTCPFCGKEHHLYADVEREVFDCKTCGRSGNRINFLQKYHAAALRRTKKSDLERLAKHRQLPIEVLEVHEAAWDLSTGKWLLPGRSVRGTVHDLRRYDPERKLMMSTAGCVSQLMGQDRLVKAREGTQVWLCEGEWDGMAMRWLLNEAGSDNNCVVAVPGAGVLKPEWARLFQGKPVIAAYDADEAGALGAEKAKKLIGPNCRSLKFISWPKSSPKGWDVRDHVTRGMKTGNAKQTLKELLALVQEKPRGSTEHEEGAEAENLRPLGLTATMREFEERLLMTEDLRRALLVCFAVCFSNDFEGDPLWLYLVGTPGAGKTMLLSALAGSRRCVFRSTVTPHSLVSGWRGDGANDPSLIPRLKGLTFVAKDFTEVLSMPQMAQDEVFSTLRGAYDGMVQKSFGNGVTREYLDCRFSMLAGVTNAIHGSRGGTLGERFLKFQLSKTEGAAADAVVRAAMASVGQERVTEEALREVTARFLSRKMPAARSGAIPERLQARLSALVQLVAYMRAQVDRDRYSQDILYRPAPEAGTRLAKQLTRLALSLSFVMDKEKVDEEAYEIVEKVGFDTAYGFNLDAIDGLMKLGGEGTRTDVADRIGVSTSTLQRRFDDLQALGVIKVSSKIVQGGRPAAVFRVSKIVQDLWYKSKGEKPCKPQKQEAKSGRRATVRNAGRTLVVRRSKTLSRSSTNASTPASRRLSVKVRRTGIRT